MSNVYYRDTRFRLKLRKKVMQKWIKCVVHVVEPKPIKGRTYVEEADMS